MKIKLGFLFVFTIASFLFLVWPWFSPRLAGPLFKIWAQKSSAPAVAYTSSERGPILPENTDAPKDIVERRISVNNDFIPPMDKAGARIIFKRFGQFVTPEISPVQPDKFYGFHAGVDWEILPGEEDADVAVRAVCGGPLRLAKKATGYGGVAVQECSLNNKPITVIYGHLDLKSVAARTGDYLPAGALVGLLGAAYSEETDGARKHLHLAFHRGEDIYIRGYLKTEEDLAAFIDPCLYVCPE